MRRHSSVVRFLLVGLGNTVLGLATIYAFKWFARWDDVPANAMGYAIGITFSFIANKRWTFRHEGVVVRSFARFVLICAIGYAANLAVLLFLVQGLEWNGYLAQIVAIGTYAVITYWGSRYYAFGSSRNRLSPVDES